MEEKKFLKAAILTLVIVVGCVLAYELRLRTRGYSPSFNDEESLWANVRSKVYEPSDKAVVFIGSSRIKFDLDIPTWEKETGTRAVQLAMVGSTPVPVLHNLAEDKKFKGRLIVDVTEVLFFSQAPPFYERPTKGIKFYTKETPSEKASFQLNRLVESNLAFLDKDFFSLDTYLRKFGFKNREGVKGNDPLPFPWEFDLTQYNRQSKMHDRFVSDTNLQNQVRMIWSSLGQAMKSPPPSRAGLDSFLAPIKADIDKIKARGGQVLFVRTPSTGPFLQGEMMGFPKEKFWNRLLEVTGCPGIHFQDYESLAHFQCPEFSHLSPADAIIFTKNFIPIIEQKGWTFRKSKNDLTIAN